MTVDASRVCICFSGFQASPALVDTRTPYFGSYERHFIESNREVLHLQDKP